MVFTLLLIAYSNGKRGYVSLQCPISAYSGWCHLDVLCDFPVADLSGRTYSGGGCWLDPMPIDAADKGLLFLG